MSLHRLLINELTHFSFARFIVSKYLALRVFIFHIIIHFAI